MSKILQTTDKECHDCGQNGPEWCSINHGVLLCDECCSVHLTLGRHISQIKSLKRIFWSTVQFNLINELISNGANLIWEYSLRDPQNKFPKKKPTAKDSLAIKTEFIRAKYQQMNYINRIKDETNGTLEDLNLQLHSIVRTDNIITCLRFLSQGADPNFRNPESGTSSMHVAASRGQSYQIELLFIFGGDPALVDASGVSPNEYARLNGFNDLADRLIQLQYELTDRLSCFIGGKTINHKIEQHIILPELSEKLEKSDQVVSARQKLQQLPDSIFEDLTMDVYDEVDRRELKTIWYSQVDKTLVSLHVVPFLPVNPSLSATRNQGRQKLARYDSKDFNLFIYDILNEVRRRYFTYIQPSSKTNFQTIPRQNKDSSTDVINAFIASDDELVYDKVASDDENNSSNQIVKSKRIKIDKKSKNDQTTDSFIESATEDSNLNKNFHLDDLKSRLLNTETQIKYLACAHNDLKNELSVLYQMIQRLLDEKLLNKVDQQVSNNQTNQFMNKSYQQIIDNHSRKSSSFIESDYDNATSIDLGETSSTFLTRDKRLSRSVQKFAQIDENSSDNFLNENCKILNVKSAINLNKRDVPININRSRSYSNGRYKTISPTILTRQNFSNKIETNSNIDKYSRKITQQIVELFNLIKENKIDRYETFAQRINNSVQNIIYLSERFSFNGDVRANLNVLITNSEQLLSHTKIHRKHPPNQIEFIIDDCYNIALATRNIISLYEKIS